MKARTVFPSFDEPSFKIPFTINITAPTEYQVLGTTLIERTETTGEETTHFFKQTAAINTDVLAIAVGMFDSIEVEGLPIPSKIYLTKGQDNNVEAMTRDIPQIFRYVQSYFSAEFPYQKLDFLVLPIYSGAGMENVGLVTLHEDMVTFSDNNDDLGSYNSHKLIAHEIIHMWFGNLVTMRWWDDLWLNESFSEWLARKAIVDTFPNLHGELDLPQLGAFWDDFPSASAIKREIKSVDDYHAIGQVVYTKGHAIVAMVEKHVGEKAFQLAIIDYIKKFKGQNVSFLEFIKHMESHTGYDLNKIFNTFLSQPQYPLISFVAKDNQLTISQEEFTKQEAGSTSLIQPNLWHVPLRLKLFTDEGVKLKSILLDKATISITLPESTYAIFPDVDAVGYFRYQVKDQHKTSGDWLKLLSDKEKKSLLANNNDLVKGNYLRYADALALQLLLLSDKTLNENLVKEILEDLYNDFFDFVPLDLHSAYRRYFYQNMSDSLDNIRWYKAVNKLGSNTDLQASSLKFLGSRLQDKDAIAFAKTHYQSILNEKSQLAASMQNAVLDVMASNSGQEVFQQFQLAYKASNESSLKHRLIRYMGYFNYTNSVTDYYDFLFSKDITKTEFKGYYLQYPVYNPSNRVAAISYLEHSIDKLFAKVSDDEKQWQPYSFASGCSPHIQQRLNKLYRPYLKEVNGLKDKLANVNHMINQCMAMQNANHLQLKSVFAQAPEY